MRHIMQPDPWSTSTGHTLLKLKQEGPGHLFATHTVSGHSASLAWPPGVVQHRSESLEDSPLHYATPRGLRTHQIHHEAARAANRGSRSMTARVRSG
mmetsp:Transcript_29691/g.93705  ORF Transcript_29691/g.93705 Transcript_29691/m.93705 type:complete len:97 (+) Transcript_29691:263-553(+)